MKCEHMDSFLHLRTYTSVLQGCMPYDEWSRRGCPNQMMVLSPKTQVALYMHLEWSLWRMWSVKMLTCSLSAASSHTSCLLLLESVLVWKSLRSKMLSRESLNTIKTTTKFIFSWWNGERWLWIEQHGAPWSSACRAYQSQKLHIKSEMNW